MSDSQSGVAFSIWSNLAMIDRSKVKCGEPLSRYRFKPDKCIVNSSFSYELRQGLCTQKELAVLKTLVVAVGIEKDPSVHP